MSPSPAAHPTFARHSGIPSVVFLVARYASDNPQSRSIARRTYYRVPVVRISWRLRFNLFRVLGLPCFPDRYDCKFDKVRVASIEQYSAVDKVMAATLRRNIHADARLDYAIAGRQLARKHRCCAWREEDVSILRLERELIVRYLISRRS